MSHDSRVHHSGGGIRQQIHTWKWHIVMIVIVLALMLAIAVVASIGEQSYPTFWADVAANFVADGAIAVIGFGLATVAYNYWERHGRQTRARKRALLTLRNELDHNLHEFEALIEWAEKGVEYFRGQYDCWEPPDRPHPRLKTSGWQRLTESGLALALADDVWLSLEDSYTRSSEAKENLHRRANQTYEVPHATWSELLDTCLPEFEKARDMIRDALAELETGLPQPARRSQPEDL